MHNSWMVSDLRRALLEKVITPADMHHGHARAHFLLLGFSSSFEDDVELLMIIVTG